MKGKIYTLLIVPGAHGELHKIRFPMCAPHLGLVLCVVGILTIAALGNSYSRMLLKVSNYNTLRSEREALKAQYRSSQEVVRQTQERLDSLQSLAAEVALTYRLSNAHRPGFPPSVLIAATRRNSTPASYGDSFYAFSLMKTTRLIVPGERSAQGLWIDPVPEGSATPSIWPVRGPITAGFGQRMDPFTGEGAFHAGVDIAAPSGTQVRAAADGILFRAGPDAGYGNEILLDHGYGITTKYGHLSKSYVVVGQEVKRGQVIGAVGMTGRTTGPHLHYEVLIQETPVNPAKYLRG